MASGAETLINLGLLRVNNVKNGKMLALGAFFLVFSVAVAGEIQEILQGSSEKVFFEVLNASGGMETAATCTVDVWNESGTNIVSDLSTSNLGGGIYYFITNSTWQLNRMQSEIECSTPEGIANAAVEFSVVSLKTEQYLANITEDIGDPSAAGTTLYDYLLNSIKSLIDTLISRLGIPSDYGYNNLSAMANASLKFQQNELVTVAGTVTNSSGPINGADIDVGVQSCTDISVCSGYIGGFAEDTSLNGMYSLQFTRALIPGKLYRVNTTIYNAGSMTTTFSYFTN